MNGKIRYNFSGSMWKHGSAGGWHLVSLPKSMSKEIRENLQWQEEGWGRMKAEARIEELTWQTAIWFDTKKDTYVLPIKAVVRKKLHLELNKKIEVILWI